MNILHINTIDNRGGAGIVHWRLSNEQKKRGHHVSSFVGFKYSEDPNVREVPKNPLYYRMSRFLANDLRFSRSNWILKTEEYKKADIIHCHNIHSGFFNLKTLEIMSKEKPVVWTLQDLWPITSGCTDSYRCKIEKPRKFCGVLWDNRKHLLEQKKKIYRNSNFTTVTSSQWMTEKIKGSVLGHLDNRLILNGIDTSIFNPRNKLESRNELSLPLDKKIILFIAVGGIGDRLKGANYIEEIARYYLNDKNKLFVAIGGKNKSDLDKKEGESNVIQTGYIGDENILAKYYSAADFFLYPSRADNSPLVVAESMACGTPIVSFETDGIPEMISEYGLLARREDLGDLLIKTNEMLSMSQDKYLKMRSLGIEKVKQNYSLEEMTTKYLSLYSELISNFQAKK
ncbi:MAG: Glycosyl transferase, group 1/2 family protein [Parcubacteria group bacterium GW2011_GWA1_40_21]|nr:MAG: glycosyl transferase, group 1/2 family protein [Parcubacteria group bacterium GW2011_GWC1_40_13]KKR53185.1 MAG: Glycosyl transferase, group 1/2 family protein [Parcubacteria group bacterium GW2011_GWA1_40_21]